MRKSSNNQPALSAATLESLLDAAPVMALLLQGPDHLVLFANHQLSQYADNRPLAGRPLRDALPELQGALPLLDRMQNAEQRGELPGETVRLNASAGIKETKWRLDWLIQPLRPKGSDTCLALFSSDLVEVPPRSYDFPGVPSQGLPALNVKDLKHMYELSSSLFAVLGKDGRYRRGGSTYTKLLGWSPEEVLGQTVLHFVHPADRERTEQEMRRLAEGLSTSRFENRLLHKDGSIRWISWTAAPVPHEEAIYALGRDVTASRRVEEVLRREAEANGFRIALADTIRRLEHSADIRREAAKVIGEHFRATRANFARITAEGHHAVVKEEYVRGVPSAIGRYPVKKYRNPFSGRTGPDRVRVVADLEEDPRFTAEDRAAYRQLQIRAIVVIQLVTKNQLKAALTVADSKARKWSEADVALLEEAAERVWAAIERSEAEAALRKTEERYRLMGRATNDVIWDWDLETDKVEWNEAVVFQLGYTPTELGPTIEGWYERLHPEDRKRVLQTFDHAVSSNQETWIDEYRFRKSDGGYVTFLDRGHIARDASGKPYRMIGSMLNLTERQRAEETLRRLNAQLIDSDRRKDEFLAMLAHELRNPLAAVHNAVQLLKRTVSDPAGERYMDILQRQTHTLGGLVDDLLDVSRVTRGLVLLKQERVNLTAVADRAMESVRALLETHEHEIKLVLPREPVMVKGDPVRLEQILVNLLTNAAKYTDPGGEITLSVGTRDDCAEMRVRDTGIGIAPDVQKRIFSLFGQAERGLDRAQGGLGIGLTIVKNLVELHGGRIDVQSEGLGRGAEFTVTLPLAPVERIDKPAVAQPQKESARAKRILVVDDSADIADTLALLLEDAGHEVIAANDGPSALKKAEQFDPELVLLDIGLPGMSGYDVAKQLRQNPHTHDAVLAALTGYGQASDRELTEAAGFNAHFVKPVDLDALRHFIDNAKPTARLH